MNDRGQYGTSFARGQYGGAFGHGHAAATYGRGGYARVDPAPHWSLAWPSAANGRGQYGARVGATGFGGSGIGVNANTEMDEVDAASEALNSALTEQLPALLKFHVSKPISSPTELAAAWKPGGELNTQLSAHTNDPRVVFYSHDWLPWRVKWNAFAIDNSVWWKKGLGLASPLVFERDRYFTVQPYRAALLDLYRKAKALGFKTPPEPDPPNESAGDWLDKYKKPLLYGAIGVGGLIALVALASVTKSLKG